MCKSKTLKELEEVTLIASGYEWECPKCEFTMHEIEIVSEVYCRNCNTTYTTYIQHAEG